MTTLKELQIDEISLVDAGANPGANVLLIKRKSDDLTEQVTKLIDKLNANVDKFRDEEFLKLARRYEILGQKSEDLAPMLKSINASNKPLYNKLIDALNSALEVAEHGKLFQDVGKRGDGLKSNDIQKYAAQIRKENPSLTFRQALDAAYLQHPELQ